MFNHLLVQVGSDVWSQCVVMLLWCVNNIVKKEVECYLVWCLTDMVFEEDIKGSSVSFIFPSWNWLNAYTHAHAHPPPFNRTHAHTHTHGEEEARDCTVIWRAKSDKLQSLFLWCTSITPSILIPSLLFCLQLSHQCWHSLQRSCSSYFLCASGPGQ